MANNRVAQSWHYRTPLPDFPGFDPEAPSVVVQLGGEMADNLAFMASGLIDIWKLERDHRVNATLVLRHQDRPKGMLGETYLKRCFPFSSQFSFQDGNDPDVTEALKSARLLSLPRFMENYNNMHTSTDKKLLGYINTPIYRGGDMAVLPEEIDPYYDELRQVLQFDESCCGELPDADESVFHLRNIQQEMPRRYKNLGFCELGPNRSAYELFGHLKAGDKVAITSRFAKGIWPYVNALKERGIRARAVTGQTGVQNFCFLLKAQKELVGTGKSTFFLYAAILGNATLIRNYSINRGDMPPKNELDPPTNGRTTTEMARRYREDIYDDVMDETEQRDGDGEAS